MAIKKSALKELCQRLDAATGRDDALDREIADVLEIAPAAAGALNFTSSVDACIALIGRVLPHWHWHVGHGPLGILPYATVRTSTDAGDSEERLFEAIGPTVPLALLRATIRALIANAKSPR